MSDAKVYNLSEGKAAPSFLSERAKRALAKDPEYARRIDLIQDFSFPTLSRCVRVSEDGRYICAAGGYPPQVKVYDVKELSMKCERHVDAQIVSMLILSEDFSKLCFLGADRSVSFHAKYGTHYTTRIPTFGRDLYMDKETSDLYISSAGSEIYRLNLSEGRFMQPWATSQADAHRVGHNCLASSPAHRLVTAGGEDGVVRVFDTRVRAEAGSLRLPALPAATCLAYEPRGTGLSFAVGTETGWVHLFDLRSQRPVFSKEHMYGLGVHTVAYRRGADEPVVVSADSKQIKGWRVRDGAAVFNIETSAPTSDVCIVPVGRNDDQADTSGLLFASGDQERIQSFYVPALGPAPSWTSFLDSLTEELEEKVSAHVYDDFKFITRAQLDELKLEHLVGTKSLRPWMHGFFVDARLYDHVKAVNAPSAFDEWRKQRERERVEKKHAQKIAAREERMPKVNRKLADSDARRDARFEGLFTNPDFDVNEESEEYKLKFPSGRKAARAAAAAVGVDDDVEDGLDADEAMEDVADEQHDEVAAAAARAAATAEAKPVARALKVKTRAAPSELLVSSKPAAAAPVRRVTMANRLEEQGRGNGDDVVVRGPDGALSITFKAGPESEEPPPPPPPRQAKGKKARGGGRKGAQR